MKICDYRKGELFTCLRNNNKCVGIDKIFLVLDDPEHFDDNMLLEKVVIVRPVTKLRQSFDQLIHLANENILKEPEERIISIVCNADIYFNDANIALLRSLKSFTNECFALSRWDVNVGYGTTKHFDIACSQDTWIFDGVIRNMECDFAFGKPGCDNIFASCLIGAGYKVYNASKQIQSFHLHNNGVKTYTEQMRIKGKYTFLPSCNIPEHLMVDS